MPNWEPFELGGTQWYVDSNVIKFEGRTQPVIFFTKGSGEPRYGFVPISEPEKTGPDITKATFLLLTPDCKDYEQTIPAQTIPSEVRDFVSTRIQTQMAGTGMRFTEGLIESIERGDEVLQDANYVSVAEIDDAINRIQAGDTSQSSDAKQATAIESLIAGDKPADYHEQIDRALDEGGPAAAAAYAAQFEKSKGHAAQETARREQGHGTEQTR